MKPCKDKATCNYNSNSNNNNKEHLYSAVPKLAQALYIILNPVDQIAFFRLSQLPTMHCNVASC